MSDLSELDDDRLVWRIGDDIGREVARRWREMNGEVDRLKAENERLIRRAKLLHDATIVLRNGMGGHGHWDDSMRRGAGCPVCIAQQKARDEATRLIGEAVGSALAPGPIEGEEPGVIGSLLDRLNAVEAAISNPMAAIRNLFERVELLEAKFNHPALVEMLRPKGLDLEPKPAWTDRLAIDPNVSPDSPTVKGTWVTVSHVVSLIVDGWSWSDIMRSHPELTEDDIRACLAYQIEESDKDPESGPAARHAGDGATEGREDR